MRVDACSQAWGPCNRITSQARAVYWDSQIMQASVWTDRVKQVKQLAAQGMQGSKQAC